MIVKFNVDHATYVGDEEDGCYYQTAGASDGWYVTVIVDCNTASFVENYATDDGPYDTEKEAEEAGKAHAQEWCINNEVDWSRDDG